MEKLTRRGVLQGAVALGALGVAGCASSPGAGGPVAQASGGATAAPGAGKRLLVLGGTKFLGPPVVEAALARGYTVTLFNRGKTRPELFPNVEKLHGDRDGNLEALKGRTWDAVVDTSGYVPRVVRDSARLLAPSVGQYVFISSISVYKEMPRPGMDESTPVATVEDEKTEDVPKYYGALKALCEREVEAAFPGRATNIRPGLIVGPDDPTQRFTYWPLRVAQGGEVLAPGSGEDPVQFIDARDLAEFILVTLEKKHVGAYNATGPRQPLKIRTLLETCRAVSGSQATFIWADAAFLEKQKVSAWTDMPVWVTPEGELAGMSQVSIEKAVAHGLRFRPLEDTVRDTLAWFNGLSEARKAELMKRAGLAPEREREVLAEWKQLKAGG